MQAQARGGGPPNEFGTARRGEACDCDMAAKKGFTIKVSSRYEEWWRYNVELMVGCFDAAGCRTGFVTASSHVADAGAEPQKTPVRSRDERKIELTTPECDRLQLYIYIIPHTLPSTDEIDRTQPFEAEITIACGTRRIGKYIRKINQWSGASIEMHADRK